MARHWKIDGSVDLTAICESKEWHRQSVIESLVKSGIERADAEAYTEFAFEDHALLNGGKAEGGAEDAMTDAQYDRLQYEAVG